LSGVEKSGKEKTKGPKEYLAKAAKRGKTRDTPRHRRKGREKIGKPDS
jgi:hypothetical protein